MYDYTQEHVTNVLKDLEWHYNKISLWDNVSLSNNSLLLSNDRYIFTIDIVGPNDTLKEARVSLYNKNTDKIISVIYSEIEYDEIEATITSIQYNILLIESIRSNRLTLL